MQEAERLGEQVKALQQQQRDAAAEKEQLQSQLTSLHERASMVEGLQARIDELQSATDETEALRQGQLEKARKAQLKAAAGKAVSE